MAGEIQTFAWGKLIRTEIAKQHRFPVGLLFEDHFWTHLIFQDSGTVVCIPQTLVHYRQRKDSISYTFTEKRLDVIKGWEARIHFLQSSYQELLFPFLERCAQDVVMLAWLMLTQMKHNKRGFQVLQAFVVQYRLSEHCSGSINRLIRSIQHGRLAYAMRMLGYKVIKKL